MKPGDRVRLDPATNSRTGRKAHHWTRLGTIVTGRYRIYTNSVRVQWDGCITAERVHPRFLELVEVADAH